MRAALLLVSCLVIVSVADAAINWQPGNWALGCYFPGNDLATQKSTGPECGGRCAQTAGNSSLVTSSSLASDCLRRFKGPLIICTLLWPILDSPCPICYLFDVTFFIFQNESFF
jgi:hypothetical protein